MTTTNPSMSRTERAGFELSVAFSKENPFVRGWETGNDPEVQARIESYNQRERERCKAAALALLDL